MMEKKLIHPLVGEVTLRKRIDNKSIRITVRPRTGVSVSMPRFIPYSRGLSFLESKIDWVLQTQQKQQARNEKSIRDGKVVPFPTDSAEIEALRERARRELVPRLKELSEVNDFGFTPHYHRVAIRNNRSNWGSCSGKNNINLNIRLVLIPSELRDYVLLHELCHLHHHNHGKEFYSLLDRLCHGEMKQLRKELQTYKFQ